MASKSIKQGKKDQKAEVCGNDGKEVSMAAIANLLEEHWVALSMDFKTTVSTLEVKLHFKDCFARDTHNLTG